MSWLCEIALLAAATAIVLLPPLSAEADPEMPQKLVLNDCLIVINGKNASYVTTAAADLENYLREITGSNVRHDYGEDSSDRPVISLSHDAKLRRKLGDQGYTINSSRSNSRLTISITGSTQRGLMEGINGFMLLIRSQGKIAYVDGPLDITEKPSYEVRGLHLNGWMFANPYSFRTWTEAEWKSYIDALAYQHVNLLYIWPFMEIIPLPVSKEDQEYLEEVRRVVDYAQTAHGMQVWIMQAANRVATGNVGVADPRLRPYWRYDIQQDMNPGDPEQFNRIMASHEALYKIVNNVDGVCTIDTDPGSYRGSSIDEYMAILKGCRELLNKHNIHGRNCKLIQWMWGGWGLEHPADPEWQRKTVQAMKTELPEPWWLVSGSKIYLPMCKEEGVLGKTVLLHYGCIEDEPSYPGTNPGLYVIPDMIDWAQAAPGLLGVMGNVQCPILQCGRVYHLLMSAWDAGRAHMPSRQVYLETCELLYPEQKELIADAYDALGWTDAGKLAILAAKLENVVTQNELGRPGLISRKLFPDYTIVAKSLLMQVKLRAALQRMYADLKPDSSREHAMELMSNSLDAYLAWDRALGWHDLWGSSSWTLGRFGGEDSFQTSIRRIRRILGSDEAVTSFFSEMTDRLASTHERKYVQDNGTGIVERAVLTIVMLEPGLESEAAATASSVPEPSRYPARFAIDDNMATLYWPGALTNDNQEWIQLSWQEPKKLDTVNVYFLRHDSMWNRTIHLQAETSPGTWEDIATCKPVDERGYAIARFKLDSPATLGAIRVVNLLDIFGIEVR